ncbi:MAG: aerobic carbon-monoxide dehydrogenase large subunit, partial [Pseudonocardiales bacterium]|nr:aerobic carbon-monoxide dehydrogenase large subunit [Pseudonocardiales bacterium]
MVGQPVNRVEDPRLLVGAGRFLDDLGQDAAELAVLRSPHAHARITDIDVTAALEVQGLLAIYTYEDLSGPLADPLPLLIPHPAICAGRTQYALARDEVNYVGEAIAVVVAENRYLAEDAVERIVVSYRPLPPVVGVQAARAAEHLVHEDAPGNVAAHFVQEVGDAAAAIAAAPFRLDLELAIERSASTPLEGRGVLAQWDSDSQRLRMWTSTQTS